MPAWASLLGLPTASACITTASPAVCRYCHGTVKLPGVFVVYLFEQEFRCLTWPVKIYRFCCFTGSHVRVDTWVETGTTVSPHYDSLLAKLMVGGWWFVSWLKMWLVGWLVGRR